MRVVFLDLEGTALTSEELNLIQHPALAGIIFFSRNYQDPEQFKSLVASIRRLAPHLLLAVDHEGGRVQRFKTGMTLLPAMDYFGKWYERDMKAAEASLSRYMLQCGTELKALGIDINLMPVLDMGYSDDSVVSGRAFSENAHTVRALGNLVINALHAVNLLVAVKHFPGHGGVIADSHNELPVDARTQSAVSKDYMPFKDLVGAYDMLMPAHVVYSAYDKKPASFSAYWLHSVLRESWEFQGLILSDDLSMKSAASLIFDPIDRAYAALSAGCDFVLVCNHRENAQLILEACRDYYDRDSFFRISRLMQESYERRKMI